MARAQNKDLDMLGFHRGGVLSPALFNLFMADIPRPNKEQGQDLSTYADDVNLLASNEKLKTAELSAQEYLDRVIKWIQDN